MTPKEFERIPELELNIRDALEQFEEIYIAGDKLVFTFESQADVEKGIRLLKTNVDSFEVEITLKEY